MGFVENRGSYFRGRYKRPDGGYGTVAGPDGRVAKFPNKRAAKQAADAAEAEVRGGTWRDPRSGRIAFQTYAIQWFAGQDLAEATMQAYKRALEQHLIPRFGDWAIADIATADVDAWEREQRDAGYAPASAKNRRGVLHAVLADAVEEGLVVANAAAKRRGRGRRAGKPRDRGVEKTITDAVGALLVAERAALLAGRDDEFTAVIALFWTGMRWGELVGLETRYARLGSLRVEWQLWEADDAAWRRIPPKEDSRRTIDAPAWLSKLLARHVERTAPAPCECHNHTYVFSGRRGAAHRRRNGFAAWVFHPAASGWFPAKAPQAARPVPLLAEPWPGAPVRGRNSQGRAEACWAPVAAGLTPHGLRHAHRSLLEELGTPKVLMDERMGHADPSIGARYAHVTAPMREALKEALTERWEAALDARRAMHPRSPVPVLDELLGARAKSGGVVALRRAAR